MVCREQELTVCHALETKIHLLQKSPVMSDSWAVLRAVLLGKASSLHHLRKSILFSTSACYRWSYVCLLNLLVALGKTTLAVKIRSWNNLHFYPWRKVACKTTAIKRSFSNCLYSLCFSHPSIFFHSLNSIKLK